MKNFLKIIFWEYLQNFPILAGFVWAFEFWQKGQAWQAVLCIGAGSILGALTIALTEGQKQIGYREPLSVMVANIAGLTAIMFVMLIYMAALWSNWVTDLCIGVLCGIGLGIVQSFSAKKIINVIHCLALGIASPLLLLCIRWLMNADWSVWIDVLLLTLLATVIIGIIDYAPDEFNPTP